MAQKLTYRSLSSERRFGCSREAMWDVMQRSLTPEMQVVSSDAPWRQVVSLRGPHVLSELTTTLIKHVDEGWICTVSAVTGPDDDHFYEAHARRLKALINWQVYNLVTQASDVHTETQS